MFTKVWNYAKKTINKFVGEEKLQTDCFYMQRVLSEKLDFNESNALINEVPSVYSNLITHDKRFYQKSTNGNNFIFTQTVTDLKENFQNGHDYTLYDLLSKLQKHISDSKGYKIFIPIAQIQAYGPFGSMKRGHYTLLELDVVNGSLKKATHIDSKGLESSLYSLNNLQPMINEAFEGENVKLNSVYTGEQSFLDNVNCGRFVIKHILETVNGYKSLKPNKEIFADFDFINNDSKKDVTDDLTFSSDEERRAYEEYIKNPDGINNPIVTKGSINEDEFLIKSEEDIFESKFSSNLSFDNDEQRKLFEDWDNEIMANNNHNNQNDVPLEYSDFEDDEFVLMGSQEDLEESFIYLD